MKNRTARLRRCWRNRTRAAGRKALYQAWEDYRAERNELWDAASDPWNSFAVAEREELMEQDKIRRAFIRHATAGAIARNKSVTSKQILAVADLWMGGVV